MGQPSGWPFLFLRRLWTAENLKSGFCGNALKATATEPDVDAIVFGVEGMAITTPFVVLLFLIWVGFPMSANTGPTEAAVTVAGIVIVLIPLLPNERYASPVGGFLQPLLTHAFQCSGVIPHSFSLPEN